MLNIGKLLQEYLEEVIQDFPGLFLVNIEHQAGSKKYSIILDGEEGLSIQNCGRISRKISAKLDENIEVEAMEDPFVFEVSSPGAEKPLVLPRQYKKHIGREMQILTKEEKTIHAKLSEWSESKIKVVPLKKSTVKGRRDKELESIEIDFDQIIESKVIISFK